MEDIDIIDRSVVAIFDIEGFSKKNPENQAKLVKSFIERLEQHLSALDDLHPNAFSTGDGAIVSIGRSCKIEKSEVEKFLNFIIEFTTRVLVDGLIVRVAVNYSEKDRVILLSDSNAIGGDYIQIGDTINIATRIISFCEPREIMFSESLVEFLRKLDLENLLPLNKNDQFVTKHGLVLHTYTYNPPDNVLDYYYTPNSPSHPYKKYTSFPPITIETLQYFMDNGLELELRKVVSNAYDAMRHINDTKTFLSWNVVLNVLISLNYDPEDSVYVLSRNDNNAGFWTQSRKNIYVKYLDKRAKESGGYINQKRVMIYDNAFCSSEDMPLAGQVMPKDDIFHDLKRLHKTNSFYSFPNSFLFKYERLSELLFGFTLSTKHKYAIIAVPAADGIDANRLNTQHIGELLNQYKDYDATDGPMKAIITSDKDYIESLCADMEGILKDSEIYMIK